MTIVDCPLCTVTFLIREADPVDAALAAAEAIEEHLVEHHQGEQ